MRPALLLFWFAFPAIAANPAFTSFNTNQFSTNGNHVAIKPGALFTNLSLAAFTNAGTAAYSNATAFELAGVALTNNDTRPITLSNNLAVSGATTLNSNLTLNGNGTVNGNVEVIGAVLAGHASFVCSTGIVIIATSGSTNDFSNSWNYLHAHMPIGTETNSVIVITNAGHYFISFGASVAASAGTISVVVKTNGTICSIASIVSDVGGGTFETGFKEFAIDLPALCRIGLAFGNTIPQNTSVRSVVLNVKGAN